MNFEKISQGKAGVQHPGKAIPLCPHLPRDSNNENKVLTMFAHRQDIFKGRNLRTESAKIPCHDSLGREERQGSSDVPQLQT
jgi:hypothetical protein